MSNLSLWKGISGAIREATVHHSENGSLSIRKGKYKLEMCPGSGGWSYPVPGTPDEEGLPSMQLYDLEKDAGETTNLIQELPEIAEELKTLLFQYVIQGRSTPGTPQPNNGVPIWETVRWMEQMDKE